MSFIYIKLCTLSKLRIKREVSFCRKLCRFDKFSNIYKVARPGKLVTYNTTFILLLNWN